jgi:CRP-like cAMP-binding protein|tara:strand:+ start:985 stop:1695 length:711 start_codon:yes stop_codon:yes gene_type:complete
VSEYAGQERTEAPIGSLDDIKLLTDLPTEAIRELESNCRWIEFRTDDVIMERDDDARDVYFIVNGSVRVMNYVGDDREVTLAELEAGAHFGELSAIGPRGRTARVIGKDDSVIAVMSREEFLATLVEYPRVALRLLHQLADIIHIMNQRVSTLSTLAPRQRIYLELLRLAVPDPKANGNWLIEVVPNHAEIAGWAGTDKQEVALAIGALAREKILERKHKAFVIKDRSKLRMLASI